MSIQVGANNQLTSIGTADTGLYIPRAFTFTLKVKLTSTAAAGSLITLLTRDYRTAGFGWNGTTWTANSFNTAAVISNITTGASTSEWVSIALVFTTTPSNSGRIIGYVRRPGLATTSAISDFSAETFSDAIGRRIIIGPLASYYSDAGARFLAADAKLWSSVLSQAQIEAEWDQQAPVISTNLMVANYFDGGNISAALTSDISNISYGGTWSAVNGDGGTESNPTYSADAPSYTPPPPSLSGEDTLPILESAGVSGELTATLGATTISAAGTVPVLGALAATLGATTISSAGVVPVKGALTATLGNTALLASSASVLQGVVSQTLAGMTILSTGGVAANTSIGSLTKLLDSTSLSSDGFQVPTQGSAPFQAIVVDNTYFATVVLT